MKSEVVEIKEIGSGDYKQLELVLRVENDDGEVIPEYKWLVNPEQTAEALADEEKMSELLSNATDEALKYMKRDKTMVENPVVEEKRLKVDEVLTTKAKKGLTKEGIKKYKDKYAPRPSDMLKKDREEQMAKGLLDKDGYPIEKEQ